MFEENVTVKRLNIEHIESRLNIEHIESRLNIEHIESRLNIEHIESRLNIEHIVSCDRKYTFASKLVHSNIMVIRVFIQRGDPGISPLT